MSNSAMEADQALDILLVEDNPIDHFITETALNELEVNYRLHHIDTGDKAIEFLDKSCDHLISPPPPCPDLIILDLNLPKMNGKEVLAAIKRHPFYSRIPVIIMSTSGLRKDICDSYSLHANCYVVKPSDYDSYKECIKSIKEFWTRTSVLPLKEFTPL